MTGPHERFSGGLNKTQLLKSNIQKDVYMATYLKHRMGHFGLSLEEEKSRLIEFGRYAKERCRKAGTKPGTFTFLGFTHYCSKSRNGRFRVKRKTSKKKFAKKCREVNLLLVKMRTCRLKEIIEKLNQILTGYYHYYKKAAVSDKDSEGMAGVIHRPIVMKRAGLY